eukprot:1361188-Amorphochlora_amoeboformis.AAC.1
MARHTHVDEDRLESAADVLDLEPICQDVHDNPMGMSARAFEFLSDESPEESVFLDPQVPGMTELRPTMRRGGARRGDIARPEKAARRVEKLEEIFDRQVPRTAQYSSEYVGRQGRKSRDTKSKTETETKMSSGSVDVSKPQFIPNGEWEMLRDVLQKVRLKYLTTPFGPNMNTTQRRSSIRKIFHRQDLKTGEFMVRIMENLDRFRPRMLISPSLRTILKTDEKTKSCSLETYITLAHKDDYRMVDRLFEKALSHGKPFQTNYRVVLPTGQLCWLNIICQTE